METPVVNKWLFPTPHPSVDVFLVDYISDGLLVKGYIAKPKKPGTFPGLLYLRGGIKQVGMARIPRITQFASHGFVVFAPFYRGNLGGEGEEDFGGEDRHDAINGLRVLRGENVASSSVHVFGFSRGSVMALFTAMEEKVSSVTVWGGVSDMILTYEERTDLRRMMKRVLGGSPTKVPDSYRWRTPLHRVNEIDAPCLIIHGKKDQHVSIDHAYRLESCLQEAGKRVTTWYYNDYTHFFPPVKNREITKQLCDWMKNL